MRAVALLLFFVCCSSMAAQTTGPLAVAIASGSKIVYASDGTPLASVSRSIVSGPLTGSALISESGLLATPAGSSALVTATRTLTADAVATAAARLLPYVSAGMLAYDLYKAIRCNSLGCDAGQDPQSGTGTGVSWVPENAPNTKPFKDPADALAAWIAVDGTFTVGGDWNGGKCLFVEGTDGRTGTCPVLLHGSPFGTTAAYITKVAGGAEDAQCPATIDALDPSWSVSAGSSPGADGKCPTGRYSPATESDIATKVKTADPQGKYSVKLITDAVGHIDLDPLANPRSITGPDTIPGIPTVTKTTNPDGTTSTTTKTPSETPVYTPGTTPQAPAAVTYGTTTVTQTCTGSGSCSSTTTTTDAPSATAAPKESEACTDDPTTLGCLHLGDLPTDAPSWTTKDITYSVDDLGLPSACPAPYTFSIRGWSMVLDYTPACNVAPTVNTALTILGAIGCAMFILKTVKT